MNPARIMELLHEAAKLGVELRDTPGDEEKLALYGRTKAIQVEFNRALASNVPERVETCESILVHLFLETLENRPERMVELFPVFACLCGDPTDNLWICDIDWSIADRRSSDSA